jgi:hypothetical protein
MIAAVAAFSLFVFVCLVFYPRKNIWVPTQAQHAIQAVLGLYASGMHHSVKL